MSMTKEPHLAKLSSCVVHSRERHMARQASENLGPSSLLFVLESGSHVPDSDLKLTV